MKKAFFIFLLFIYSTSAQTATSSLTLEETRVIAKDIISKRENWKIGRISDTKSMFPTLDTNCLVILEPISNTTYLSIYDIILFGENILHRIGEVKESEVFIRGDNTTVPDGWIAKLDIKYRVVIILYYSEKV